MSFFHVCYSSFGYRGEDGRCLADGKRGETFGPHFGTNDVIGCGIEYSSMSVFYTKNGVFVGKVGTVCGNDFRCFPAVSMSSPGDEMVANFDGPFAFNLFEYNSMLIEEEVSRISAVNVAGDIDVISFNLVAAYFEYMGYFESARALIKFSSGTDNLRSTIRTLLMNGECQEAISVIESREFKLSEIACVSLYSLNVRELMRTDVIGACKYLKNKLSPFRLSKNEKIQTLLIETCSLFCYPPSPITQREQVWQLVNREIQGTREGLETLVRQIVACKRIARENRGNKGLVESAKSVCAGPIKTCRLPTAKNQATMIPDLENI